MRSKALHPDWEQRFEFYDNYQRTHGFELVETKTKPSGSTFNKLYQKVFGVGQAPSSIQKNEIASESESQPADLNYTLYIKDVFLEIMWKWNYKPEFGQKPLNLTPHCPDCERKLVPNRYLDGSAIFVDRVSGKHYERVACPVHRKDVKIQVDKQRNYVTVIASISKKIKSGEWKEIVEQQRR